jgi:membrane-associated PAP2 superfamily phosphatase
MPKLAPINLVLSKGFNMWVLQILTLPSLRLRLLKSPKKYNTYVVNIQYKCRSMGKCNSHTFNCDYSLHTPTKQILSLDFEMC